MIGNLQETAMTEQVTIEAEFFKQLMDARDASERLEFTVAEATRERDREHQRAEKFLRSLIAARKELRKRPDAAALNRLHRQVIDVENDAKKNVSRMAELNERCDAVAKRAEAAEAKVKQFSDELATTVERAEAAEADAATLRQELASAREYATKVADKIRKDCDGLAEKANAAKSEIFRLRQELTETQRVCDEAVKRADMADGRAKFFNDQSVSLTNEAARLSRELTVTRNAGEGWKARCEKAERTLAESRAELESLRARIDPVTLAEAIVGSLFTSAQGIATRLELKQGGIADGSERHLGGWVRRPAVNRVTHIIRDHMKREGTP
jgi:chromosome segregation ATPase